jgi:hypothetical protein
METTQDLENVQQLNQLDPTTLQNLLGGTDGGSLIPESLVTTIMVSVIVLNVLGLLFLVFYIISMIRKWKVQSAVLHMRKDLAEIKAQLVPAPVVAEPQVQPAEPTPEVSQSSDNDTSTTS